MIKNVDWNNMWMKSLGNASWRKRHGDTSDFWDRRAERYNESIIQNDRAKQVISKLDIDYDCNVLDIGSGPGTLAIPLANMVKHVTVVEPSAGMLSCLKRNAQDAGLSNISCIQNRWEDVVAFEDIDKHDVLIASYSLSMLDMKAALSKMDELADKSVYLFTFAGGCMWGYDQLWPKLYGDDYIMGPDYIYLYNILYDMGICPNVEITTVEHKQRFASLESATKQCKENLDVASSEGEDIIRSHLSENLTAEDGVLWSKSEMKSAMIWWRK